MRSKDPDGDDLPIRFNLSELAGSVGDFGTILPIVFGVAAVTDIPLAPVFLFFGIWFILTGWYYRLPIPIEPMKAIGVVVIAEGVGARVVAASGILLGVLFYALGYFRVMGALRELIPDAVVRGIQLGLALLLLRTSLGFIGADPLFFLIALGIVATFFLLSRRTGVPDVSALIVVLLGVAAGIYIHGLPEFRFDLFPGLVLPTLADLTSGLWDLAVPQIPLTIVNSILATALLASDLFRRNVEPDRLSRTIGLMNIVSAPLGGFPMCHGAGGLAAQYRFGARTGGANIYAGLILLFALLFSSPEAVAIIPVGVFGALLIFVALELGRHGRKTESLLVTVTIAVLALILGITVAFIAGLILAYGITYITKKRQ
ncbi:MAG: putative sulfate/molybdate transporter [Methanomicrobiales archaeon]|nr:putative sulfate/molybdate transporter [Methanomicrobiales archaeon]